MFHIDIMRGILSTIKTLKGDALNPVTGLHCARHRSRSVITTVHRHLFMEILLVTDGAIRHVVNGREECLEAGAARLIRTKDAHSFDCIGNRPCERYNIAFSVAFYEVAREALGAGEQFDALLAAPSPPCLFLSSEELPLMARRLEQSCAELVVDPKGAAVSTKALLMEFLAAFARSTAAEGVPQSASLPEWMAEACAVFKAEQLFVKGVPELVRLAGRSHEYVCREFGRVLNTTPTDYVNGLRLTHAASLLARSEDKIHAVALDAGFDSLSHFHHLFLRKFGVSPARYRRSVSHSDIP